MSTTQLPASPYDPAVHSNQDHNPYTRTVPVVPARIPGVAVAASMAFPGFGQLYANSIVLGVLFFMLWTVPFWLVLAGIVLSGFDLSGLGTPPPVEGGDEGGQPTSPFSWMGGLIDFFRFGVVLYLGVWVAAVVHAYFAAKKFNRKNETEVR